MPTASSSSSSSLELPSPSLMTKEMITTGWKTFNVTSYQYEVLFRILPSSSSWSLTTPSSSSSSSSSSSPILPWNEPYEVDNNDFAVPVYGYITPVFVIIAMVTNCLVCAVLVRKPMRTCTNTVLMSLAVSDTMTGLWPLPCFVYFYTLHNHVDYLRHNWCFVYFCFIDYLPTAFHTASIWLTVLLATQRFLHVCHPAVAKQLCTIARTLKAIGVIYAVALATQLCRLIDGTFVPVSVPSKVDMNENITACTYLYHPIVETYINIYFGIFYWFRVLFVHILPCLVLVLLNAALVRAITSAQRRRKRLLSNRTNTIQMEKLKSNNGSSKDLKCGRLDAKDDAYKGRRGVNQQPGETSDLVNLNLKTENLAEQIIESTCVEVQCSDKSKTKSDRTHVNIRILERENSNVKSRARKFKFRNTRTSIFISSRGRRHENNSTTMMLVVVVCLFLLVELPLAILFILNFIDNTWTLELLPKSATDTATLFMNAATIISYSCNFFVYCAMSNQFRQNFKALFERQTIPGYNGSVETSNHFLLRRDTQRKNGESKVFPSTFTC